MTSGVWWCFLLLASSSAAGKWRWPEGAAASASVRIDTKVRFIDADENEKEKQSEKQSRHVEQDDAPFEEPVETEGFYNRPPGAGRYPVRVEAHRVPYLVDGHAIYRLNNKNQPRNEFSDGTLDSLQYCKCVSNPDCNPRPDSASACGVGKYLCCYKRPNRVTTHNSEFFNEVEDQRPMLLPGHENLARPFPPPPGSALNGLYGSFGPGHDHDSSHIGVFEKPLGVLVGPDGPSGVIGPQNKHQEPSVLVGPEGPTGVIGPVPDKNGDVPRSESAQRGVLVGPVGPTGIIGSYGRRPVLVGPGGPTGIIGPGRGSRGPNVLVGPGGPTGIIGPKYRQPRPGVLTGPGGPTGSIGPGRQILVGPGGPTGHIGPQGYFGCARSKRRNGANSEVEEPPNKEPTHKHRRNDQHQHDEHCYCKN